MEKIEDTKKGLINKIFSTKSKKPDSNSSGSYLNWEFIIDSEGNYLNISQEVEESLGVSPQEFNNQSLFTFSISPTTGENLYKKFINKSFPLEEEVIFKSTNNDLVHCILKLKAFLEEYNQKPTYIGLVQINRISPQSVFNSQADSTNVDQKLEADQNTETNGHKMFEKLFVEQPDNSNDIAVNRRTPVRSIPPSYTDLLNDYSIEANHLVDPIELYKLTFDVIDTIFPENNILLGIVNRENGNVELPISKQNNEVLYFHKDELLLTIAEKIVQSRSCFSDESNSLSLPTSERLPDLLAFDSYLGFPAICGNQVFGSILVSHDQETIFTEKQVGSLKKISTIMANALENVIFFHEMQNALSAIETREKHQNQVIQAIKIVAIDGLSNLLQAFEFIGKSTNVQRIIFAQPDFLAENKRWNITHQWVSEEQFDVSHLPQQITLDHFGNFVSKLRETGFVKVDFEKLESPFANWLEMRGVKSVLMFSINPQEEDFSLLILEDLFQNHIWKNEELNYLRTIVEILSQKLIEEKNNQLAINKLQFSEKMFEIIRSLNIAKSKGLFDTEKSSFLDHVQSLLREKLGAHSVVIHFVDENYPENADLDVILFPDQIEKVLEKDEPASIIHSQSDRTLNSASITNTQIITPLRLNNNATGVVIYSYKNKLSIEDQFLQNHQRISDYLSLLMDSYQLHITNNELHQKITENDDLKNKFISNISHEFRTPLNAIIGFSKVILTGIDGPINPTQEQDLNTIHSSGQTLLKMINDVLDMSKIESENFQLEKTKTNMKSFLDTLLPEAEELIKEKVISIEVIVEDDLPVIDIDRNSIKQVILNLISNAVKNTDFGKIILYGRVKPISHQNNEVIFSVIDTGNGIAEADQKNLFKPFAQMSHLEKNRSAGFGLGLALSKAIIELHGGKIGLLKSVPGEGSEFYFTLPVK